MVIVVKGNTFRILSCNPKSCKTRQIAYLALWNLHNLVKGLNVTAVDWKPIKQYFTNFYG